MSLQETEEEKTQQYRGEGQESTEAEVEVMYYQTKKCLEPLKAGRGKKEFGLESLEGTWSP